MEEDRVRKFKDEKGYEKREISLFLINVGTLYIVSLANLITGDRYVLVRYCVSCGFILFHTLPSGESDSVALKGNIAFLSPFLSFFCHSSKNEAKDA